MEEVCRPVLDRGLVEARMCVGAGAISPLTATGVHSTAPLCVSDGAASHNASHTRESESNAWSAIGERRFGATKTKLGPGLGRVLG
jgi:hypothetical protein